MNQLSQVDVNHIKFLEAIGYQVEFNDERENFCVYREHPKWGHMGMLGNYDIGGIKNFVSGMIDGISLTGGEWHTDIWGRLKPWENELKCKIPEKFIKDESARFI